MIVSSLGKVAKDIWQTNQSKSLPRGYWIRAKALLTILDDFSEKGVNPSCTQYDQPTLA
jgi:hypothetical protein